MTLVVADDHPLFVAGISRITEHAPIDVVAAYNDGRAALEAILELQPDVALLDLRMPELDGRQVLLETRHRQLPTAVLLCSAFEHPAVVQDLLQAGACGFVSKRADWNEIAEAVLEAARGEVYLAPTVQRSLAARLAVGRRPLSERERSVIALAAEGLTDIEIARQLIISQETVRTNLKRSAEKLQVRGRTAIVARALRDGYLA